MHYGAGVPLDNSLSRRPKSEMVDTLGCPPSPFVRLLAGGDCWVSDAVGKQGALCRGLGMASTKETDSPQGRSRRRASMGPKGYFAAALALAVVLAGLLVVEHVLRGIHWHITFPYEIKGWTEGHYLYNALQILRGENFYTDPAKQPVTSWPYGFLYPLVMTPFVWLFGPELWIGRAISTAAAGVSLAWVFRTASGRAGTVVAGLCAVALACATFDITAGCWSWTQSDSLYVALGLGSLACAERLGSRRNGWWLALTVLLSCASCCAKQTGVGFVLAIATSLLVRQPRLAAVYTLATGVVIGAILAVGHVLTDGQFERYLLLPISVPYAFSKILPMLGILSFGAPLLLLMAGWQLKRDLQRGGWGDPVSWAILLVGGPSLAAYVKHGATTNSFLPLLFLLSVPAGVRLGELIAVARRAPLGRLLGLGLLLLQLVVTRFVFMRESDKHFAVNDVLLRRAGRLIEAELRDPNEHVLMTARVAYAIHAGSPVYDSVLMAGGGSGYVPGKIAADMMSHLQNRLKQQIADRFFHKILIPESAIEILRADVKKSLQENYHIDHVIMKESSVWMYTPMLVLKPRASTPREKLGSTPDS